MNSAIKHGSCPLTFKCFYHWDNISEYWNASIEQLDFYGSHYEIFIQNPSSMRILIGRYSSGIFALLPDYDIWRPLTNLNDFGFNQAQFVFALGNIIDGTTIAFALKELSGILSFS
jgi:hypothetical protein